MGEQTHQGVHPTSSVSQTRQQSLNSLLVSMEVM